MMRVLVLLCALAVHAVAQDEFRLEVTNGVWFTDLEGTIRSSGTAVDLGTDFGLEELDPNYIGKLSVRPGRKHQINVEGGLIRITGNNTLTRQIVFNGQTYTIQEPISSEAGLTFVSAGYQYNFVARDRGHAGFTVDGVYFDLSGTIRSVPRNLVASESRKIGLPLAGGEFRAYVIPRFLNVNGSVRGMSFGNYGRAIQAEGNIGLTFGPVTLQGGYRFLDIEVHDNDDTFVVSPRFSGPVVSIQFRM